MPPDRAADPVPPIARYGQQSLLYDVSVRPDKFRWGAALEQGVRLPRLRGELSGARVLPLRFRLPRRENRGLLIGEPVRLVEQRTCRVDGVQGVGRDGGGIEARERGGS